MLQFNQLGELLQKIIIELVAEAVEQNSPRQLQKVDKKTQAIKRGAATR